MRRALGPVLFEQAPCLLAVLDAELRFVATNARFNETLTEPAAASTCYGFYRQRIEPCPDCPALLVFASGQQQSADVELTGSEGQTLSLQIVHLPLRDANGSVTHVLQLAELPALGAQMAQIERLARVGLTAAGLAHTIKNILAGLQGSFYVVDSGIARQDAERTSLGWTMVKKYVEQVNALVKNMLRLTAAQSQQRETIDPTELVREVVELFATKAELAGIDLRGHADEQLAPVQVDRAAIAACLSNLVSNAIDACTWDPSEGKQHQIEIVARAGPTGSVELEVSDTGMGIAADDQTRVLRTSFTTKGMRGTGLGLLLTRKAVEEHGGTVRFRSTPGAGATFCICLPACPVVTTGPDPEPDPFEPPRPATKPNQHEGDLDEQEDPRRR